MIPGSYIYTNAISSILNQDLLVEWSVPRHVIYLTVLITILIIAGIFLNGKQFSLVSLSIIAFHIILNIMGFIYWNQIIPMIPGALFLSSSLCFL